MFTQYNFLSYKSALICRVNSRTFICQISLCPAVTMGLLFKIRKMGGQNGHGTCNMTQVKIMSIRRDQLPKVYLAAKIQGPFL